MLTRQQLRQYVYLMRLDKPIGILLLLWPTMWALWLASAGRPDTVILLVFIAGVILMRSTGCILNDFADRSFDGHVTRTQDRPLARGTIPPSYALCLAATLSLMAFLLVLHCNLLTIVLAFIGAVLTLLYPYLKRVTHLPQVGLGLAFAWGIPMAFAAETGSVSQAAWVLFLAAAIWPVIYDTMYAMVDRADDVNIGVKSTAILFAQHDRAIIALLQLSFLLVMGIVGWLFQLPHRFMFALLIVAVLFIYQQWLIRARAPQHCFAAFLNNHWVGFVIFLGILSSYI